MSYTLHDITKLDDLHPIHYVWSFALDICPWKITFNTQNKRNENSYVLVHEDGDDT
uniref:Uncharacterized protein n=1 Tax=Helianthus annuus TaxID=4232 RepID=A0A251T1S6_HELAN